VPVSEVSEQQAVQQARQQYELGTQKQRWHV
jgi:TPP-dependent trihydroxycyclohexane-1,2-dione (THcHDO) dehydratase